MKFGNRGAGEGLNEEEDEPGETEANNADDGKEQSLHAGLIFFGVIGAHDNFGTGEDDHADGGNDDDGGNNAKEIGNDAFNAAKGGDFDTGLDGGTLWVS